MIECGAFRINPMSVIRHVCNILYEQNYMEDTSISRSITTKYFSIEEKEFEEIVSKFVKENPSNKKGREKAVFVDETFCKKLIKSIVENIEKSVEHKKDIEQYFIHDKINHQVIACKKGEHYLALLTYLKKTFKDIDESNAYNIRAYCINAIELKNSNYTSEELIERILNDLGICL